jgi:hypothetical protein
MRETKFWLWFVSLIPKKIRYYIAIDMLAKYSTTKDHSHEIMGEIKMLNVVKEFENGRN